MIADESNQETSVSQDDDASDEVPAPQPSQPSDPLRPRVGSTSSTGPVPSPTATAGANAAQAPDVPVASRPSRRVGEKIERQRERSKRDATGRRAG